jgi:hypothetical protein
MTAITKSVLSRASVIDQASSIRLFAEQGSVRRMTKKTFVTGLTALALTLAPLAAMPVALAHADDTSTTTYDPWGNGSWTTSYPDGSSATTTYDPWGSGSYTTTYSP